jgi:TetR/AcrR family transcriptional regulator
MGDLLYFWSNYLVSMASGETEVLIFRTAYQHFLQEGFQGARMQQIAEAAGISKALLFYHFGTKEELFAAVCARATQSLDTLLVCLNQEDGSPGEKLARLLSHVREMQSTEPEFFLFMLSESLKSPDRFCPTVPIAETVFAKQWSSLQEAGLIHESAEAAVRRTLSLSLLPFLHRLLLRKWYKEDEHSLDAWIQSAILNYH